MDQQEAQECLKSCGGCLLTLIKVIAILIALAAIVYGLFWVVIALVAVGFYSLQYILWGILGAIVLAIVGYAVYVILCALGITGK